MLSWQEFMDALEALDKHFTTDQLFDDADMALLYQVAIDFLYNNQRPE